MPTTTNFGWTTPADTDYVKDGANAIRTLANGIDTSLVDLKGGTTGQILSKNSNADLDYTWINNDQGDITGVTAGTGLTGGGTSGAVTLAIDSTVATLTGTQTLTNKTISASSNTLTGVINNTLTTTTGDIIYASAANTPARLGIGSTGNVLTVTGGVPVWAAPAGATALPAFSAYKSGTQNLAASTWTKITFETENFDTDGKFATSRFTPTVAGYYEIIGQVGSTSSSTSNNVYVAIRKNGAEEFYTYMHNRPYANAIISRILYLDSDDYVEVYANFSVQSDVDNGNAGSGFSGAGIRS